MFCPNCGREVPDTSKFCPGCGSPVSGDAPTSGPVTPGVPAPPVPDYVPTQGYVSDTGYVPGAGFQDAPASAPSMKWFKFIIWFQLFAFALLTGIAGITGALGLQYEDMKDVVYLVYDGMQIVDVVFGLAFVALAVFAVVVRMELAKFKREGPQHYLMLLAANIGCQVLYLVAIMAITGLGIETIDSSTVSQILTSIVLIFVNKVYFDKRAHLFNN